MRFENLSKAFGEKQVLQGLTHTLAPCTCLMAPSGAGKTTLLTLILGLEKPDTGAILEKPLRISVLFQEDRLCDGATAPENLCLLQGVSRKMAEAALAAAGITDFQKPVSQFSGGMKRRVALLRALLFPSDLLLLDEPFQGLDTETRTTAVALLKKHRGGRDILLITHDKDEAALVGGEIWVLPSLP